MAMNAERHGSAASCSVRRVVGMLLRKSCEDPFEIVMLAARDAVVNLSSNRHARYCMREMIATEAPRTPLGHTVSD
jgi:hypothetical protein